MLISHKRLSRSCLEAVKDVSSAYNLVEKKGGRFWKVVNEKHSSRDKTCVRSNPVYPSIEDIKVSSV